MDICAITMVYNESFNLPFWVKYYGNELGVENLYIIDNGSTDGSTSNLPSELSKINFPRSGGFSDGKRALAISRLSHCLLEYYDIVIYVDCDEFIVPRKDKWSGLKDFFHSVPKQDVYHSLGFNVWHKIDIEKPIDKNLGILKQRRFAKFSDAMCKPVAITKRIHWGGGFHSSNRFPLVDGSLINFHIKNVDISERVSRQAITKDIEWSVPVSQYAGPGQHQRWPEQKVRKAFESVLCREVVDLENKHFEDLANIANCNVKNVARKINGDIDNRWRVKVEDKDWFSNLVFRIPNIYRDVF